MEMIEQDYKQALTAMSREFEEKTHDLEEAIQTIQELEMKLEKKDLLIKTQTDTIDDLVEQNEKLNEKIGDLLVEINNLEKDKENLAATQQSNQPSHTTIEEEEDDELVPKTPPSRQYPRESIGQWSANRMRNNMSVKSLISSMEKGRRPL